MILSTVILWAIFLPNLQLNIGKKYLKTAIIIDESLIVAIVSRNYSTKLSYIFQLKHNARKISIFLYYRTSETNWRVDFFGGVE